jgi:hypothetical protein
MEDEQCDTQENDLFIPKYDDLHRNNCDLEPNHTHFLFFDDGPDDLENVLVKRQEIERTLSSTLLTSMVGYHQESGMQCQY